jgi:hypothetical protein
MVPNYNWNQQFPVYIIYSSPDISEHEMGSTKPKEKKRVYTRVSAPLAYLRLYSAGVSPFVPFCHIPSLACLRRRWSELANRKH